jgi:Zn-dependent peptidase ImmA (M78 family)
LEDAAEAIKETVATLQDLESGRKAPNVGQLERMAAAYELPLATLLMPAPLPANTRPRLPDFRTLEGRDPGFGHETQVALEEVHDLLEALADLRSDAPDMFDLAKIPQHAVTDSPSAVGEAVRKEFNVPVRRQLNWRTDREGFLRWRQRIEACGVFVFQYKMDMSDCRGFSILDDRGIPAIVVNSDEQEYKYRTFSLLHEFGHIVLRNAGISDENRSDRVERWCNQFAAYFLMPREDFKVEARRVNPSGKLWSEIHVAQLSNAFGVSKSSITYHLEDLGIVPENYFGSLRADLRMRRRGKSRGIATHVERLANRLGARPVDVVLAAVDRGVISKVDAYEILDVRPMYFAPLRQEINQRKAAFGGVG